MIIGLCGLAGSGKDTVADSLVLGHGYVKLAFADLMKRFCKEVFDFTDEQLWGTSERRNEPDERFFRGDRRHTYPNAPRGSVWIPLSNQKGFALIDVDDHENVNKHSWSLLPKEGRNTDYAKGPGGIKLHQFLMGEAPEGHVIDHVNGDGLDNRRKNLRFCSHTENRTNQSKRRDGTCAFKGVGPTPSGKWRAFIKIEEGQKHLGTFETAKQAALAYDEAARKHFGAFARTNAEMFLTPRYALQTLGTEFGRDCYPNVWVDYAIRKAKELDGAEGVHYDAKTGIFRCARPRIEGVAISDVRFWNELEAIKKAGGKVIRIKRAGAGLGGANGLHPSEVEQASIADACFDAIVQNDGGLDELHDKVGELLTSF